MTVSIEIIGSFLDALNHVTNEYNQEKSGSVGFVPISSDEYFKDRCDDLLEKYHKSYESHLESLESNMTLYKDVIKNREHPAVKSALDTLIAAVNSAKSE